MSDISVILRCIYFLLEAMVSPIGYIVVNAPNELKIARRLAWRNSRVLPYYNGIEISDLIPRYTRNTQKMNIVSCGRITAAKIPLAFALLCAKIEKKYPDVSFTWIGDGSNKEVEK